MREGYQHCSTVGDGRCFDSEARWWQKVAVFYKVIVMAIIDRPFSFSFFFDSGGGGGASQINLSHTLPTTSKNSVYLLTAPHYFCLHKRRIITTFYNSMFDNICLKVSLFHSFSVLVYEWNKRWTTVTIWQYIFTFSLFLCYGIWMEQMVDYCNYLKIYFVKF